MSNFCFNSDVPLKTLVEGQNYRKVLAHSENVMIAEVYFENGAVGQPHTHVHEQISYCLEGEFEYTIEDNSQILKKGDSVFVPSNLLHSCKVLSDKGVLLDVFAPQREDFLE